MPAFLALSKIMKKQTENTKKEILVHIQFLVKTANEGIAFLEKTANEPSVTKRLLKIRTEISESGEEIKKLLTLL